MREEDSLGHLEGFEEVTPIFLALSTGPTEVTCDHVALIERFTILLYNHTSSKVNIDEACQKLFTMKSRAMDAIPPTRAALLQHIKRAVYQGGHCWGKTLQGTIGMPPPGDSAHKTGDYVDHLPEASTASRELRL